ncbi:hypothetical protein B0H14DRAFT_3137384 [Mycena olivaceomarginata]|nr:hypothetical protein B0H14DRAFT_3137384 [Mycena olivaceomarginata]
MTNDGPSPGSRDLDGIKKDGRGTLAFSRTSTDQGRRARHAGLLPGRETSTGSQNDERWAHGPSPGLRDLDGIKKDGRGTLAFSRVRPQRDRKMTRALSRVARPRRDQGRRARHAGLLPGRETSTGSQNDERWAHGPSPGSRDLDGIKKDKRGTRAFSQVARPRRDGKMRNVGHERPRKRRARPRRDRKKTNIGPRTPCPGSRDLDGIEKGKHSREARLDGIAKFCAVSLVHGTSKRNGANECRSLRGADSQAYGAKKIWTGRGVACQPDTLCCFSWYAYLRRETKHARAAPRRGADSQRYGSGGISTTMWHRLDAGLLIVVHGTSKEERNAHMLMLACQISTGTGLLSIEGNRSANDEKSQSPLLMRTLLPGISEIDRVEVNGTNWHTRRDVHDGGTYDVRLRIRPRHTRCRESKARALRAGDLEARKGAGSMWELQCIMCNNWIKTSVPSRHALSIANHFINLESHCAGNNCVSRSSRASTAPPAPSPRKARAVSSSAVHVDDNNLDQEDEDEEEFQFQYGRSSSLPPESPFNMPPTPSSTEITIVRLIGRTHDPSQLD